MEIRIISLLAFIFMLINMCHSGKSIADQIEDILCKSGKKNEQWNRGMMCCQSINCYHLKKDTELNNETRSALYQNEVLNDDTRGKGCAAVSTYLDKLKDITMDLRGDIKNKCADEKGVEDLMNLKVHCFKNCAKGDFKMAKRICPLLWGLPPNE